MLWQLFHVFQVYPYSCFCMLGVAYHNYRTQV